MPPKKRKNRDKSVTNVFDAVLRGTIDDDGVIREVIIKGELKLTAVQIETEDDAIEPPIPTTEPNSTGKLGHVRPGKRP